MIIIKRILNEKTVKVLTILSNVFCVLSIIFLYNILGIEIGSLFAYTYILGYLFISSISYAVKYSIKKLTYMYQTKGFYNIKNNMFRLAINLSFLMGLIFSLIYIFLGFLLAKYLVLYDYVFPFKIIMMDVFVISIIIFLTPVISVFRGYFLGHRLEKQVNISIFIQNILKSSLFIILIFTVKYLYKIDNYYCLFFGLIGYLLGYFFSFLFLIINYKKSSIFTKKIMDVNEPIILNINIIKSLIKFIIPGLLINIILCLFNYVDIFNGFNFLVNLNFSLNDANNVMSIVLLWANIFNIIIIYLFYLIIVNYIKKIDLKIYNKDNISFIINISFFILLPLCIIFSFLCKPLWNLFYAYNSYGYIIIGFNMFNLLVLGLLISTIILMLKFSYFKSIIISLSAGVIIKFLLQSNLIIAFSKIGMPVYLGIILSSFIGYLSSFIINLFVLNSNFNIISSNLILNCFDMFIGSIIMILPLSLLRVFFPINSGNKFMIIFCLLFYFVSGILLYLFYAKKCNLTKKLLNTRDL